MKDILFLSRYLLGLAREGRFSRLQVVAITLAGLASGLATTGLTALAVPLLGRGAVPGARTLWLFAGLCVALPGLRFLSQVLLVDFTQGALLSLRLQLSARVLAAPLRQLEAIGAARLLATLTTDIAVIVEALGMIPILCMNLAIVTGGLAYLGWLSWRLLLLLLALVLAGVASYQLPLLRALAHFRRSRETLDRIVRQIRELVEGTKELKMHRGRRDAFLRVVADTTAAYRRATQSGNVVLAAASSWGQALFYVALGALVFAVPRLGFADHMVLVGYALVLFQLMAPFEILLTAMPVLSRACAAVRAVDRLGLSLTVEAPAGGERQGAAASWQRLELAGVTHAYRQEDMDDRFQLGPLDLVFRPGEMVFVIGGNGSGKTTLAKLLVGLYAPESGEIRLDGRPIGDADRERYRELFAVVFSTPFVFAELLGLQHRALDEEARLLLAKLHLERKVEVAGGVLSTVDLSQGQRKRLALLTSYLEDRPIYLFDEWAADQDPVFKRIFYHQLLPQLRARGKTVFVISHDDHYFHVADRIVRLADGRIELDVGRDQQVAFGSITELATGSRAPRAGAAADLEHAPRHEAG
jgi:putative pyoverdin transport system ATP-binding/permease protein